MEPVNPVLNPVRETFDTWAKEGHGDRMERGHWPTASQILEQLDLKPAQCFLDIGCGNGYTVAWAAEKVGADGKAIGVDLAPEMIAQAKAKFQQANTDFQVADVTHLPFADETFDAIVCIESLYYYPDIPKALQEIHRVLKPSGRFAAMADFYRENPFSAIWQELMPVAMTYLSEAEYTALFKQAGLESVRTERLFNSAPVDVSAFKPGWGYESPEDVETFRRKIGSLAIWGHRKSS